MENPKEKLDAESIQKWSKEEIQKMEKGEQELVDYAKSLTKEELEENQQIRDYLGGDNHYERLHNGEFDSKQA